MGLSPPPVEFDAISRRIIVSELNCETPSWYWRIASGEVYIEKAPHTGTHG